MDGEMRRLILALHGERAGEAHIAELERRRARHNERRREKRAEDKAIRRAAAGEFAASLGVRLCAECRAPMAWSRRDDARYCSDRCRQRAYRDRVPAGRNRMTGEPSR
jgi:hypothetical protein